MLTEEIEVRVAALIEAESSSFDACRYERMLLAADDGTVVDLPRHSDAARLGESLLLTISLESPHGGPAPLRQVEAEPRDGDLHVGASCFGVVPIVHFAIDGLALRASVSSMNDANGGLFDPTVVEARMSSALPAYVDDATQNALIQALAETATAGRPDLRAETTRKIKEMVAGVTKKRLRKLTARTAAPSGTAAEDEALWVARRYAELHASFEATDVSAPSSRAYAQLEPEFCERYRFIGRDRLKQLKARGDVLLAQLTGGGDET